MATISRLSVDLVANSAKFRKDLQKASKDAKRTFGSMMKDARKATAAFAAVGVAMGGVLVSSARAYGNYSEALQDVKAKTGATAAQLDGLSDAMRKAAKATKFTAIQTAEAGTFLAQAGLNVREIHDALRPTLDLAAATKTSVQNTADFMTNIMKGLGMQSNELGRASDVLSVTTAKSNTNLTDLATAMSYAAPSAKAMGMEIEETSALLGSMANAGIKGSMAGTALRRTFSALSKGSSNLDEVLMDTDVSLNLQQKTLKKLGVQVRDTEGNIRGLKDILIDLKKAGGNEEDMLKIFGDRAGSAMMQFMNDGLKGAEALEKKLLDAGGAAEKMADVQMDSLNGDMTKFTSQLTEMQLIIAEGGINKLFRGLTQAATKFLKSAQPALKTMSKYLDEVAVALGIITGAVILVGLAKLTAAMVRLGVAMLANPLGMLIVGITVLGVLIYKFSTDWSEYWDYIVFHTKQAVHNIGVFFTNMGRHIVAGVKNLGINFKILGWQLQKFFTELGDSIASTFNHLLDVTTANLAKNANTIKGYLNSLGADFDLSPIAANMQAYMKIVEGYDAQLEKGTITLQQYRRAINNLDKAYIHNNKTGTKAASAIDGYIAKLREGKTVVQEATRDQTDFIWRIDKLAAGVKSLNAQLAAGIINNKEFTESFNILQAKFGDVKPPSFPIMGSEESGDAKPDEMSKEDKDKLEHEQALEAHKEREQGHWDDLLTFQNDYAKSTKELQAGSWNDIIAVGAKGSKKMLMLQKAMSINSIIMATATGIARALEMGFPQGLYYGAKVAITGAAQLAAVKGQFHDGIDNVPNTGTYLLEQGERVVDKRLNKDMSDFLANQSQGGNTTNNNPVLNFNVSGGDSENVEQMLLTHRGKFEGMIRDIYNESAQNSPF